MFFFTCNECSTSQSKKEILTLIELSEFSSPLNVAKITYLIVKNFSNNFAFAMQRNRVGNKSGKYAIFGNIQFPRDSHLADYDTIWDRHFTDRKLITVTQC